MDQGLTTGSDIPDEDYILRQIRNKFRHKDMNDTYLDAAFPQAFKRRILKSGKIEPALSVVWVEGADNASHFKMKLLEAAISLDGPLKINSNTLFSYINVKMLKKIGRSHNIDIKVKFHPTYNIKNHARLYIPLNNDKILDDIVESKYIKYVTLNELYNI